MAANFPSDMAAAARTFAEVRRILFDLYGVPEIQIEEGDFTANLRADLNRDAFRRLYEWKTDNGPLRLGIPSRLDGQIRMEITHAKAFPAGYGNGWSYEEFD